MKRTPLTRKTPLRATSVPKLGKTPIPKQRVNTGPDADVKRLVWKRDEGRCARCGNPLGSSYSRQHRKPRAMGGTSRAEINCPANLVMLCGSATTGCHGWAESHRQDAAALGYLVASWQNPHEVPVWCSYRQQWRLLDCAGGWTLAQRPAA